MTVAIDVRARYSQARDEVLRQVARLLAKGCRESDTPARYGGEEFAVVAPETGLRAAAEFADRLRLSICARPLEAYDHVLAVTVSFGVASSVGCETAQELVRAADVALYSAKSAGRNRVKAYQDGVNESTAPQLTP